MKESDLDLNSCTHMEVKNMKRIRITLWLAVFPAIATLALAASAVAETVVVGTGNPDIDVPAVQAAVDRCSEVILTRCEEKSIRGE